MFNVRSDKFDPDQPRAPAGDPRGGQWVGTAEREGFPASKIVSENPSLNKDQAREISTRLLDALLSPEERKIYETNLSYIREKVKVDPVTGRNGESHRVHSINPDGSGGYTKERLAVHRTLLNEVFKDADKFKPAPGEKPHMILLGGVGGSGKSQFGNHSSSGTTPLNKFREDKYLRLDADAFKTKLAEQDGVAVRDSEGRPSAGREAYLYHEESSRLFERAAAEARRRGLNVVLDVTLKSPHTGRVQGFKDRGYKISGYYMYLPNQEAARRAVMRARDNGTMRGRMVPPEYVVTSTTNGKSFDSLLRFMDDAEIYRNDVPRGNSPIKVYAMRSSRKKADLAKLSIGGSRSAPAPRRRPTMNL